MLFGVRVHVVWGEWVWGEGVCCVGVRVHVG